LTDTGTATALLLSEGITAAGEDDHGRS
jgi:hypothetical protein